VRDAYNPFYVQPPPEHAGAPRIRFSGTEVLHILGAVLVLTLCFAIVVRCSDLAMVGENCTLGERLLPRGIDLVAALVAVASGFLLHELAHKVVAQRYGHWAEFRAQFVNLLVSYGIALGTGLLLAAPGAVLIQGQVTRRENGIISLVGPATNFVIAAIAWPLAWTDAATVGGFAYIMGVVAFANALLCLFNLIPISPLDGKKVIRWSKPAYFGALAMAIVLFLATLVWRNGITAL
jgi:Zn-dependent protease